MSTQHKKVSYFIALHYLENTQYKMYDRYWFMMASEPANPLINVWVRLIGVSLENFILANLMILLVFTTAMS